MIILFIIIQLVLQIVIQNVIIIITIISMNLIIIIAIKLVQKNINQYHINTNALMIVKKMILINMNIIIPVMMNVLMVPIY